MEGSRFNIVLDVIFGYVWVQNLVICCWWSSWTLANFILIPVEEAVQNQQIASDSLLVAFIFSFIVFRLNEVVKSKYNIMNGQCRFLIGQFLSIFAFFSSLTLWRGFWTVIEFSFIPNLQRENYHLLNYFLMHIFGFSASIVSKTGMSLTKSPGRDPAQLDYNSSQYWSSYNIHQQDNSMQMVNSNVEEATGDEEEGQVNVRFESEESLTASD